ncbi:unnamed protein product [Lasius platythorax]|uniref:Uncharacterized protein n=2 Tax=Lasius TaxID=488720 RepID=A0A0J7NVP9_LASNI|nr:hypothetical protein RF55_3239 [Lasius niger]
MLTNEEGAQLKGLMGLPGWQPPCLRARGSFCSCQSGNEGVTATEEREESLPHNYETLRMFEKLKDILLIKRKQNR